MVVDRHPRNKNVSGGSKVEAYQKNAQKLELNIPHKFR